MLLLKRDLRVSNFNFNPPEGIIFRQLKKDDIPKLVSIYPDEFGLVLKRRVRKRVTAYRENGYACFLACHGEELVAFFWAIAWVTPIEWLSDDSAIEVCNLYVVPHYRRKMIAQKLLDFGLEKLYSQDFHIVYSRVLSNRVASIRAHLQSLFLPVATIEIQKRIRKRFYSTSNRYRDEWNCETKLSACILIGDDSSNTLTQARELGEKGVKVYHLYSKWADALARSRFVNKSIRVSPWSEHKLLPILKNIANHHEYPPIVYFSNEKEIPLLARIENSLDGKVKFVNPPTLCEQWISKEKQQELAKEVGFVVVETVYLDATADLNTQLSQLSYPILCRPESPTSTGINFKTQIYNSKEIAVKEIQPLLKNRDKIIAQSYITGDDSAVWFYLCVCDNSGEVIAETVGHKLIQFPPGAGIMAAGTTSLNPVLSKLARKYFKKLALPGPMGLEAKYHKKTDQYYFIEINLRPENINGISSKEVPMNWLAYQEIKNGGEPENNRIECSPGWFWIHGSKTLLAILIKSRHTPLKALPIFFCFFQKRKVWALLDIRDPGPFWGYIVLCIKKLGRFKV